MKRLTSYQWRHMDDTWDKVREELLKSTLVPYSRMLAIMPRDDSSSILRPHCDGVYPIRFTESLPFKTAKSKYYQGAK